jgi:ATP/maltotriose-dependent transcriptional regulator MalT
MENLVLWRTKLYRPPIASDLAPRPWLLDRLNRRRKRPLPLVCAPSGYGKTTTMLSC